MNDFLVLTAIGKDRPGIVDELSSVLLDSDLNIEDSRMSDVYSCFFKNKNKCNIL